MHMPLPWRRFSHQRPLKRVRTSVSPLADLKLQLRRIAELFATRTGRGVVAMIAATQGETELSKAFRHHFILKSREQGRELLRRAIAAGEVRPDINEEAVLDLIYAPLYFRLLIGHGPLNAAFTDALLIESLRGFGALRHTARE